MRLIILALACVLLSGCAALGGVVSTVNKVCERPVETQIALELAMAKAEAIQDPVKREAAVGAVRTAMAFLGTCPSRGH